MGGHKCKPKELMSLSDENEHTFIGILRDNVKARKLQCSTSMKTDWGQDQSRDGWFYKIWLWDREIKGK